MKHEFYIPNRDIIQKIEDIYAQRDVSIDFGDEVSLTDQSQAEDCDINVIVARAQKGGYVPQLQMMPEYFDVSEIGDFEAAQNTFARAKSQFEMLPSDIRDKFSHDALTFYKSVANKPELLEELGLIDKIQMPAELKPAEPPAEPPAEQK